MIAPTNNNEILQISSHINLNCTPLFNGKVDSNKFTLNTLTDCQVQRI